MNYLNSPLYEGIRKVGFRKWYERELLSSHAHMILAFLCIVGMMAAFEAFSGAQGADRLFDVAAIIICAVIGLWALRRYLYLLSNAETIANQADCPQCKAYGLFTALSEDRAQGWTHVRCRKCAHEWHIEG
jgi:ABC-type nickel/cobalt efflux system permease component RcnA